MIRKIKNLVWAFLRKINLGGPIQLMLTGALIEDGWYKSFNTKTSVDKKGEPIPWCTYSFIKFIEPRLKKTFNVFEYGCGNSTIWYAKRVNSIKAIEHNQNWRNTISMELPSNAYVYFKEFSINGDYAKAILNEENEFNIIVIDGIDRNNCLKYSLRKITSDGIIVFDNSEREEYNESYPILESAGFRRVDFWGLGPIVNINSCTSIFYRINNCIGI